MSTSSSASASAKLPLVKALTALPPEVLSFVAPELLMGFAAATPASDMWSLGACLFYLHTGYPLVLQSNPADVLSHLFSLCGDPTVSWPPCQRLPLFEPMAAMGAPVGDHALHARLVECEVQSQCGRALLDLLGRLLVLDPAARPTAKDVMRHEYFLEMELPGFNLPRLQESLEDLRTHQLLSQALSAVAPVVVPAGA